jgi:DinB superfamily
MDLTSAAQCYEEATAQFLEVASMLSDSQLDKSSNESWSARQVIHHVADSEAQSYARLRRLIAEPGTQIQGYDEAGWGENETLGYKEQPITHSLEVFRAVRGSSLELIKRLKSEQLNNSGIHSESGEYTIKKWLETYINHPLEYAAQIRSNS